MKKGSVFSKDRHDIKQGIGLAFLMSDLCYQTIINHRIT